MARNRPNGEVTRWLLATSTQVPFVFCLTYSALNDLEV